MSMFEKIAKKLAIGVIALVSFSSLHAGEVLTEVKAAYFLPTDNRFRDIYSGGGLYSIETSVQICCSQFYPWASLGYFHETGRSLASCSIGSSQSASTHITIVPLGLGLKYLFPIDCICFSPYVGAGVQFAYAHIHNNYPFVSQNQSDWGVGGIAKAGFISDLTHCFFLDFSLDYSYMKVDFHNHHANIMNRRADLSGFSVGMGIGYRF